MTKYVMTPHTAIFSGPTSCGKTQRVLDLLEDEYRNYFENIVILCSFGGTRLILRDLGCGMTPSSSV